MGLIKSASREDLDAYRKAKANLERISLGKTDEDDEWRKANQAVADAAARLPWWQR